MAEHLDGFQMYASEISHWNAAEMGPKRDVLGQLEESCKKKGMEIGASSHRVEHWFFMGHGREYDSDVREPMERGDFYWPAMPEPESLQDLYSEPMPTEEFLQDWLVRCCEIVDKYRPKIVYFDWWIQHSAVRPYLRKFAAYYYNRAAQWGSEAVINYKHDAFLFGTAVPDVERGQFADIKPYFWQTDTAIALNSWGYTEHNDFRPAEDIICDLCDIVSKNGALLLNVGPRADGSIGPEDRAVLTAIGDWMKVNGEAVYDTHVWRAFGEGPTKVQDGHFSDAVKKNFTSQDFRFTAKGSTLYVMAMKAAEDGRYTVRSLRGQEHTAGTVFHGVVKEVSVLGTEEKPSWSRDGEGLHISTGYAARGPLVFKVELD